MRSDTNLSALSLDRPQKSALTMSRPQPVFMFEPYEAAVPYMEAVGAAETKHELPKNLLARVIHTESKFKSEAKSGAGAVGIAQIMPKHHPGVDPTDPMASIDYAGSYLKKLYKRFGNWDKAIAAYNMGPTAVAKGRKMPRETRDYLKRVGGQSKVKSGLDLIRPPVEPVVPEAEVPVPDVVESPAAKSFYKTAPLLTQYLGMKGMGPKPEGGFSELGVPLDIEGKPYYDSKQAIGPVSETLKGLSTLATHPMETIKGGLDFFLSIPGFLTGLVSGAAKGAKEAIDQTILGEPIILPFPMVPIPKEFNLEKIYNAASEGMAEGAMFFEPAKEMIIGKPTPESQLATQVLMAPITALSAAGHGVASWKGFENYPNIRGAAKFLGDISGLMTMGYIIHGASGRTKFTTSVEKVVKDATEIVAKERAIEVIPSDIAKQAQRKVLEVEKIQLELEAKKVAEKLAEEAQIKQDVSGKAEAIREAKVEEVPEKVRPKIEQTGEQIAKELGVEYKGPQTDAKGEVIGHTFQVPEGVGGVMAPELTLESVKSAIDVGYKRYGKEPTKPISEIDWFGEGKRAPREEITDLDLQTGTPEPRALSMKESPFRESPEHTRRMKAIYEERAKSIVDDPELFTAKLLNDMNRWLDGEEIPVKRVRDGLSELASRADELRRMFGSGQDFLQWRDVVREGASWARKAERAKVEPTKGVELYAGFPIDKATKELVAGARKLSEYTKRARGLKAFKPKQAAKMLREEFNRAFIDRSGNIRGRLLDGLGEDGYRVIQKMYLSKGASSLSANMLKQMRKEVYSGLTRNEKRVLDNLILADRMIDIGKYKTPKEFKYPEGLSPVESASYNELFSYIEKISPDRAAKLKRRAKAYFDWMKKPLKDMLDAELITQGEHDALASHNYRRIKLVEIYDRQYKTKVGKKRRTIYDSGVEALARGRDTDVFEPSSEIMALEVFNRAYGRILNNKANQSLLELARKDKTNPFVRVKEAKGDMIPTGWSRIFVYEKGERKAIYLSPEVSKEWTTNSPEMSYRLSQTLRYASGSPVLRTFATGINWGFAIANLPKDIMHTWFAARVFEGGKWESVYSPHFPVFAMQMSRDLATIFPDAMLRKGRYEKYIEEGGGMEFLVHQGRLFQRGRHVEGPLDTIMDFMGYFGETSEIMTRLAIRDRVIRKRAKQKGITFEEARKNPDIRREATFAARDYMDFGQGGGTAKALDNAFPYLNAAFQGSRGMVRAFKPGSGTALVSTYKLAQFATVVTGLYIAMQRMHPKSSDGLKGNIDMQNNLCIPLGDQFGFEDEKGQMRYPYLKIPLDPGQKFFKTFFEASTDKWLGNEVDVDRVVDSLKEQSPVGVTELPPTLSGVLGYVTNKDFWMNEDIWRQTDKPFGWPESKEEYIPGKTPQAYIDLGAKTGLSPERTRYAVEELVTGGTIWSYLLGQGYEAAFGDLPKSKKEQHLAMTLSKIPVVRRFYGVTNPYSQFAQPIDRAKEKSDIDRWIQNRGLDVRVEGYLFEKNVERKEIVDYMRSFKDKDVFDRLKDRFEFQQKIKALPNRSFWLRLRSLTTEARAKVYVDRFNKATPEERLQLNKEIATVIVAGGIMSDDFRKEVMKLRRQTQ